MGSMLWVHEAPWHPDPADALRALQAQFLAQNYDLPTLILEYLDSERQAVAATQAEGDPYSLLDLHQTQVELLESLSGQPLPADAQEQIEILRKMHADTGEGMGNVLDVRGVADQRGILVSESLGEDEIQRFAGTRRPTLAQAKSAVDRIHPELNRAESVCFPFYDDAGPEQPVGWYFVGNTID